jgi:hypothetical protein
MKYGKLLKKTQIKIKKMIIVYYIYLNPHRNWKVIIEGQLNDLKKSGMLVNNSIYIHICCEHSQEHILECKNVVLNIIKDPIFSESYINQFEYPGLMLLYNLAQEYPDEIMFYFHSKGMVFNNPGPSRNEFEKSTLRGTLYYYQRAISAFDAINVNKVGLWPSKKGHIWVNFFFIRASCLKIPPKITSDRWWYEEYISEANPQNYGYLDCFSLIRNRVYALDTPDQINEDLGIISKIGNDFFDNVNGSD